MSQAFTFLAAAFALVNNPIGISIIAVLGLFSVFGFCLKVNEICEGIMDARYKKEYERRRRVRQASELSQ